MKIMWLFITGVILSGCASIMLGTRQDVGISSTPTGAAVMVNNKPLGVTPIVAELKRKDNHIIKIEMEGYLPYETTLTRNVSGWVWGNIAFGGLIGLAVDAITGGMYKLKPDQVAAVLHENKKAAVEKDGLYIAVVLKADPSWEKIGNLTPQAN